MNLKEISEEVAEDSIAWFPKTATDIQFQTLCMTGELGEFANKLKKTLRTGEYPLGPNREDLCEELTDVFIYMMNIANILGMDMEWWYRMKREKNAQRFPITAIPVKDNPQA